MEKTKFLACDCCPGPGLVAIFETLPSVTLRMLLRGIKQPKYAHIATNPLREQKNIKKYSNLSSLDSFAKSHSLPR